ncbi:MAG: hypothetical protein ABI442_11410 [Gemmatimonadaceae bacterium]
MSPDEAFLIRLLTALDTVRLDYVVVGMAAAALQGAPVMTQDVDLLVRDTPLTRSRIDELAKHIGAGRPLPVSELSTTLTLIGGEVAVDVLFDRLPGGHSFEGIRARAVTIALGGHAALVASLDDVIASKEAIGRPKDLASLPILRDTQRIRSSLAREDRVREEGNP